jgi:hypothetical protein
METKPTYITFEQAKQLSNLGLDSKLFSEQYLIATEELSTNPSLDYINGFTIAAPEQWQAVEWLRVNHGIFVVPFPELLNGVQVRYYSSIFINGIGEDIEQYFDTPQEAYSAAFDYILNNLI